jgi:tetratricopeptide (TPR) repeat protein
MKRIILALSVVLFSTTVFTQTIKQVNFSSIEKKIVKSNQDIENPKKSELPKTWQSRGELMLEVYDAMMMNVNTIPGVNQENFTLFIGKPNQQIEEVVEDVAVTKYVMERVTFNFVDGKISTWTFTNPLIENPLDIAYECFVKAYEMDAKGKSHKSINESIIKLKDYVNIEAANCYEKKDYKCAFVFYSKSAEIGLNPIVNRIDTAVLYNAGFSAHLCDMFENAIDFYKKAIEYNYLAKGNVFLNIYLAYRSLEREDEGAKYLEEGFLKIPNNNDVLLSLVNYYLINNIDPKSLLNNINSALEAEPNNATLYFAEGILHDKLEDIESAEKAYLRSIELDQNYFLAVYNLGVLYYNSGVKIAQDAYKLPTKEYEKYDQMIALSDKELKKSIPVLEKAHQIDPKKYRIN